MADINAASQETEGCTESVRPTPGQADRRVERTRRTLLAALISLLAARDYDGLTVSEILNAADVGRSTFYAHFGSKDDLLRYGFEQLGKEVRLAGLEHGASDNAFGFVRPLLDRIAVNRELFRRLKGRGAKVYRHALEQLLGELTREARPARSGAFDPVAELEIQFVTGALSAAIVWWLERNSRLEPHQLEAVILRLVGDGLGGRDPR
jgi:AcrR family transcriptional regulator